MQFLSNRTIGIPCELWRKKMESLDYLLQNFIDALLQINRSRAAEIFEDLSHKATDFQMLTRSSCTRSHR